MKTSRRSSNDEPISSALWTISAKMRGMGYLFKHQNAHENPDQEDISFGIGQILMDLGKEIRRVQEQAEDLDL